MRTTISGGLAFVVALCVLPQITLAGTSTTLVRKGGEIVVTTADVAHPLGIRLHDTTALPAGNFMVLWEEFIEVDKMGLYAVWVDSDGQIVSQVRVSGDSDLNWAGLDRRAAAASLTNGVLLIVWSRTSSVINGRFYDENGAMLSEELTFFETGLGDTTGVGPTVDVAVIDLEKFVVIWQSLTPEENWRVAGRTVALDGFMDQPFVLAAESDQYRPQVASSGEGEFVIAWGDSGRVQVEGFGARSFAATVVASASSVAGGAHRPSVCSGGGQFAVGWTSYETMDLQGLWHRRFDPSGDPLDAARPLAPAVRAGFDAPELVCMDDQAFAATWFRFLDHAFHGKVDGVRSVRGFRLGLAENEGPSGKAISATANNDIIVSWAYCSVSFPKCTIRAQVFGEGIPAFVGDCNGDGIVDISELMTGVGIALSPDAASVRGCFPFDADLDYAVRIHELIAAVSSALQGCA